VNDDLPGVRVTELEPTVELRPAYDARRAPGLTRALRATAPPRRDASIPHHERTGALRERRRLAVGALSLLLGLVVIALFLLWEGHNFTGVTYSHWGPLGKAAGDDYDEGAYTLAAQSLNRGYALFSQVFSAQPAFFLPSLALSLRLVPDPLAGAHLYEAAAGALTLVAVYLLAATAYRALAGPLAAALLAVSPGFLLYAHAVESEMPMLACCTLAVAAAQSYYLHPRRLTVALAGLLLMAGTEMKLLAVVVVAPLALLLGGGLWYGYRVGRSLHALLIDIITFLLALAGPILLILLLVAPAAQWDQAVVFHLRSGRVSIAVLPPSLGSNADALKAFLGYDKGLLVAALAGLVVAFLGVLTARDGAGSAPSSSVWARKGWLPLIYLLWALSTGLFLSRYHPLFQHQFVPLLPPLALLGAGLAAAWPVGGIVRRDWRTAGLSRRGVWHTLSVVHQAYAIRPDESAGLSQPRAVLARLVPPIAGLAIFAYVVLLGYATLTLDGRLFTVAVAPRRAALIALLDRATRPGEVVICDDPLVALGARRPMAPGLEDPSRVRAAAGYLTAAQAEAATVRYHAAAIVASRPMFARYLPAYLAWAAAHYREVPSPAPGAQVFVRR